MIRRAAIVVVVGALVAAACGSRSEDVGVGTTATTTAEPPTTAESTTSVPAAVVVADRDGLALPRCEDVPRVTPTGPTAHGDAVPVVVELQSSLGEEAWYGGTWLDGGAVLAVTEDVDEHRASMDERFGSDVVRVVQVAHSYADLEQLRQAVDALLRDREPSYGGSAVLLMQNVVDVMLAALHPELVAEIATSVGTEGVCVTGADPADVPPEGPQPSGGEGWRLLADEPGVGVPYDTGFAGDAQELAVLWAEIGLTTAVPIVDFEREVVVWFGPAVSGSCSQIRLDDVVIDVEAATVSPVIVHPGGTTICTSDANPHAYVVAVDRARLPSRFTIDLGPGTPDACCPEARTEVDLSN